MLQPETWLGSRSMLSGPCRLHGLWLLIWRKTDFDTSNQPSLLTFKCCCHYFGLRSYRCFSTSRSEKQSRRFRIVNHLLLLLSASMFGLAPSSCLLDARLQQLCFASMWETYVNLSRPPSLKVKRAQKLGYSMLISSGLKIRNANNPLHHTSTSGSFSAVSTPIFESKY